MNNPIQKTVWINLQNEGLNGVSHNWDYSPRFYIEQMIDYSGTPKLKTEEDWETACNAVMYWRIANAPT